MKTNIRLIKLQFRNWPKGLLKTGAPKKDAKILVGEINYPSAPSLVTPYFKEYISVDAGETCFKIKLFSEFQHEDVSCLVISRHLLIHHKTCSFAVAKSMQRSMQRSMQKQSARIF